MHHRCTIGYWEDTISLSPHPTEEDWFLERGLLAMTLIDRQLLLERDPSGNRISPINRDRNGGLGWEYEWHVEGRPFARFMRYETEVKEDGDLLTWEVPPDHLLPWPRIHICNVGEFDAHAMAQREFYFRGRSAHEAGGDEGLKAMLRDVPDQFRGLLRGHPWTSTVRMIQNGEELPCT